MKQSLNLLAATSLLAGALTFVGCSEPPTPMPLPATPLPVEAPKPAGDLGVARRSLETALIELRAKNYTGAAIAVDAASKEIKMVAANANLPAQVKESIAQAGTNLEPLKELIEKKDASAEKGLIASLASISKLTELTKMLAGAAAGALGEMMPKKN